MEGGVLSRGFQVLSSNFNFDLLDSTLAAARVAVDFYARILTFSKHYFFRVLRLQISQVGAMIWCFLAVQPTHI
jgi:hypothetical protein